MEIVFFFKLSFDLTYIFQDDRIQEVMLVITQSGPGVKLIESTEKETVLTVELNLCSSVS